MPAPLVHTRPGESETSRKQRHAPRIPELTCGVQIAGGFLPRAHLLFGEGFPAMLALGADALVHVFGRLGHLCLLSSSNWIVHFICFFISPSKGCAT